MLPKSCRKRSISIEKSKGFSTAVRIKVSLIRLLRFASHAPRDEAVEVKYQLIVQASTDMWVPLADFNSLPTPGHQSSAALDDLGFSQASKLLISTLGESDRRHLNCAQQASYHLSIDATSVLITAAHFQRPLIRSCVILPPMAYASPNMTQIPGSSTSSATQPPVAKDDGAAPRSPAARQIRQLGLFFAGAGFLAASIAVTRRSVARRKIQAFPRYYSSNRATSQVDSGESSLLAVQALGLASLNVVSFGIMLTGGMSWAFDLSSVSELRERTQEALRRPGNYTVEDEKELEQMMSTILTKLGMQTEEEMEKVKEEMQKERDEKQAAETTEGTKATPKE